ncbi:hypothetical protein BJ546DRAFT_430892 [Cryomyces antarcticus]
MGTHTSSLRGNPSSHQRAGSACRRASQLLGRTASSSSTAPAPASALSTIVTTPIVSLLDGASEVDGKSPLPPLVTSPEDSHDLSAKPSEPESDTTTTSTTTDVAPFPPIEDNEMPQSRTPEAVASIPVLSLVLPTPPLIPEDSPSKYGIRTNPSPVLCDHITVQKSRRKSGSGLHMFKDAATLHTTTSRLKTFQNTDRSVSAPVYSLIKPSGTATAPPITLSHMRCYHSHKVWHTSRNTVAPVECMICRIDDLNDRWSCSWCCLRVCRTCRVAFEVRSESAQVVMERLLRERETATSTVDETGAWEKEKVTESDAARVIANPQEDMSS